MINNKASTGIISFLITLFLFLLGVFALSVITNREEFDPAEKGVLDLRSRDFSVDPILPLNGEWEFYPDSYYSGPGSLANSSMTYIKVPSFWSSPLIPQHNKFGTAVFHLKILLPDSRDRLSLKIKNITPNYELRVNDEIVSAAGNVSLERADSKAGSQTFFESLYCPDNMADVYISISNYHNIAAGINHEILAGDFSSLARNYSRSLILESLTLGAILIFTIYIFSTFILDPSKKESLFLALICLSAFFFTGLKNELILLYFFPSMDGEVRSKIIHIIICNIGGLTYYYFRTLFPQYFSSKRNYAFAIYMTVSSLFVLFSPMSIHSMFILPLELIGLGAILLMFTAFLIYSLKRNVKNSLSIQFFINVFFLFFLVAMLNDALLISFDFIGQVFLIVLLGIVQIMAKEYSGSAEQIVALEDSQEELNKINQELLTISQIDSLTGIANRRYFDQQLLALWQADKYMEKNVGLIMVDIDFFKNYNDFYGHQKGDGCLIKVASGLRSALLRQSDFLARYGGEEFAIILSDLDEGGIYRVAENMRKSIESLHIEHRASVSSSNITISVGCSVLPAGENCSLSELITRADQALYHAKETGRNCVVMYENNMAFREDSRIEASS